MSKLLAGIRVLELATGISGPYLGKLFADHGADVIKVEPPSGDPARRHGPWGDAALPAGTDSPGAQSPIVGCPSHDCTERSPLFLHLNTNKRSVVADLSTAGPGAGERSAGQRDAGDLEFVKALAATCDIVIEAFAPGHLDGLGLGYESLAELRPGIVLTSITPFGQTGPYAGAGYRGSDIVTYAMGGPMWGTGIDEREPVKLSGDVTSYQVGNLAAVPTLAAHQMSRRSGRSFHIDVSAFEAQAGTIDRRTSFLLYQSYTGTDVSREPRQPQRASPVGFYPVIDGWALVFTLPSWAPRMAQTLAAAGLGLGSHEEPSLAERFATPAWMLDESLPEAVEAALYPWLLSHTRADVAASAQVHKWAVMPLNSPLDVLSDGHFAAREFFLPVTHPVAGTVTQLAAPFRLHPGGRPARRAQPEPPRPAPWLGQHDAEVRDEVRTVKHASLHCTTGGPSPAEASSAAGAPAAAALSRSGVAEAPTLPLSGIRVLDLTVVWAGPGCTMYLSDLGAEVIRVDNPYVFPTATRGHVARPPAPLVPELGPLSGYPDNDPGRRPWNRHNMFSSHGRGKLSCTLDARTELGRETLARLVGETDVIVENNSLGVVPKLGLDWETVHAANPRAVMLRMPPMGLDGPYCDYLGFGANFEALCGLTSLRGYADDDPTSLTSVFHMDPASAATAAFAVLAVLGRRDGIGDAAGTGVGELIEFSQSENVMQHIGEYFIDAAANGTAHTALGNRSIARAPQGCYRCAADPALADQDDEWAVIACESDADWLALAGLIDADRPDGVPSLGCDERLATLAGRQAHHDEIDTRISAWTRALTATEVFHRCQQAGVPAGPVLRESQLRADPQMADRCWFRQNGSVEQGWHSFPGRQWRWDGPEMPWRPIGLLGDANEYVYRDVLGLDDGEWQALCDEGHITRDYLHPDGTPM
ncbi:CaiB/BaiF CoA transferase family protein [Candidatus Poriferisodalis sp.]|uniref:CaiB/BaiF CoA transferase family protein n=1 Tax=Candidatus Poriferisodalis sp. TaxID=3101277 RepID=UPI003B01D7B7